ncbi:uncharacterized protein LOC119077082 [Bradysia coprophila]|uniref:uncharacterized protein LOC119077082 n=1 Tax=Bradysia coprophila TaxID=38358 RepID=UPI00187DB39B|nr:uncharacterized protein LOC119077082 [Bradysia coprophila]
MRILKLLWVFVLLCKTTTACKDKPNDKQVSFSVEKIWQSYRKKGQICLCEDVSWKQDIQNYYNGCRTATWEFRGKAYCLADSVVNSLEEFLTKLIFFTNSNSTIVTTSSTTMLNTLSKCKKLNRSGMNIIFEFQKVLPAIIKDFNEVATKLSNHIGELTSSFTKVLGSLGSVFTNFMKEFLENCRLFKCEKQVDYKPVLKKCQKLMNTVALIGETLLNECEAEATQEVYDAVLVLDLICLYMAIAVPGINSCVMDVLYEHDYPISKYVKSSALVFDYALVELTKAVSAIVFPITKTVQNLLTVFVNITMSLNKLAIDILGLFDGVEITVGEIVRNLVKGGRVTVSASKGKINILKGVTKFLG